MSKTKLKSVPNNLYSEEIVLENNDVALLVFGAGEKHIKYLQKSLSVSIKSQGHIAYLEGLEQNVLVAKTCLLSLQEKAKNKNNIIKSDVTDALRLFQHEQDLNLKEELKNFVISFPKKRISPRTPNQLTYVKTISNYDITLSIGPAGTGKTYLAMAMGMAKLIRGDVERVILTRPAVEAGERLGFLPGDLAEKVNPYLRPLYDALHDMIDYERVARMMAIGQIEIAPIAFMRGRTLNDSYVILDEAQNCTREQMKMFLTRLGDNCQAVVTGDITQIDLPQETKSGLKQALNIVANIDGIAIHRFTEKDVVRHPLVAEIVKAYEKATKAP
jgi:phosphate starvation-inducible protein PhoH and related proteins